MTVRRHHLPELPDAPFRTGRHVELDDESRNYPAELAPQAVSVMHVRKGVPLNQGNIGACTGNDLVNQLRVLPNWRSRAKPGRNEKLALQVYALATSIDGFPGTYPPDDTGSSNLAACKAAQQLGLITGYTHTFSVPDSRRALVLGPLMQATKWTEGMFNPDADGRVHPTGADAGGHSYCKVGQDVDKEISWYWQSWGRWGLNGSGLFYMTWKDEEPLILDHGEISAVQVA